MQIRLAALLFGLGFAACARTAQAQFDGIYLGAGFGLYKLTIEVPDAFTLGNDKHVAGLNLAGGYGRSFGNFNLAGEFRYADSAGKIDVLGTSAKLENAWSVSALPGLKFGDSALLFARAGYARAKLSGSFLEPDSSKTHTGWIWGVGAKGALTRNLALSVEYQFYDMNDQNYPLSGTNLRPSATGVVIGIQYTR